LGAKGADEAEVQQQKNKLSQHSVLFSYNRSFA